MKHLFTLLLLSVFSFAWGQCPFGNGTRAECVQGCDNFVDKDGDGYCDYSRLLAKEKTDTATTKINKTRTPSRETKRNKQSDNEEVAQTIEEDTAEVIPEEISTIAEKTPLAAKHPPKKPYRLVLITALTLGGYFFTFLLSRLGILHKVYHRRIWNTVLLLTAAVSCLFGFLLVIQLNYGVLTHCYRHILTWHVECGIAMTIIAVFHVIWHLSYFKKLFKRVRQK
jgi:hypothetical protein